MKNFIFFLFFITAAVASAQVITVDALRREYQLVSTDSAACAKLYKKVSKSESADNTMIAYKGAVTAAMANHSKNKKEKLDLFNAGKKLIEQSITNDASNIETSFLRLSVQASCPKALNYNKQLPADKAFILKNYSSVTAIALKRMISSYIQQSSAFTETEKQQLK